MATNYIEGIDVSNHQGPITWMRVAVAGCVYAFVKATEGDKFTDMYYKLNVNGARASHVLAAPYHFLSHDIPADRQAKHFLAVIDRPHNTDLLLPAVDVEPDPASTHALKNRSGAYGTSYSADYMVKLLDDFLSYVRDGVGGIPGLGKNLSIYSYSYFWQHFMGNTSNYAQACPLWIASYTNPPTAPKEPVSFGGWPYWTFWQYTDNGTVAGYSVDRDRFKGSIDDLRKFANY